MSIGSRLLPVGVGRMIVEVHFGHVFASEIPFGEKIGLDGTIDEFDAHAEAVQAMVGEQVPVWAGVELELSTALGEVLIVARSVVGPVPESSSPIGLQPTTKTISDPTVAQSRSCT